MVEAVGGVGCGKDRAPKGIAFVDDSARAFAVACVRAACSRSKARRTRLLAFRERVAGFPWPGGTFGAVCFLKSCIRG